MYINDREFTFGADPEVFLKPVTAPADLEKYYMSAHGLVPGTKQRPHRVNNGFIQLDGMAAEFNIDPAGTKEEFVNNIKSVLTQLQDHVGRDKYRICATPVAEFEDTYFESVPKENKVLGCDPDWDAYTEDLNPTPDASRKFRTGAGHIHIGWGNDLNYYEPMFMENAFHLVKHLDTCVGKPLSNMTSKDRQRTELYGKLGSFRPKPYGIEYRTPSNYWVSNPKLVDYVFSQTCKAIENAYTQHKYDYNVERFTE